MYFICIWIIVKYLLNRDMFQYYKLFYKYMAPAIPKSLKDCCEAVLRILLRFNFKVSYSSQLKQRYDESAELSVIFKFSNNVAMHCALCRPALALFTLRFLRHFESGPQWPPSSHAETPRTLQPTCPLSTGPPAQTKR